MDREAGRQRSAGALCPCLMPRTPRQARAPPGKRAGRRRAQQAGRRRRRACRRPRRARSTTPRASERTVPPPTRSSGRWRRACTRPAVARVRSLVHSCRRRHQHVRATYRVSAARGAGWRAADSGSSDKRARRAQSSAPPRCPRLQYGGRSRSGCLAGHQPPRASPTQAQLAVDLEAFGPGRWALSSGGRGRAFSTAVRRRLFTAAISLHFWSPRSHKSVSGRGENSCSLCGSFCRTKNKIPPGHCTSD